MPGELAFPRPLRSSFCSCRSASVLALRLQSSPRSLCPTTTEPNIDAHLSVNPADEIKTTTCYMCACRCGIRVHLKDGTRPLHRGQPRPSGQPRRDLRQGRRRHHAALLAGAAARSRCCASASAAPASSARSNGTRRWRLATGWLGDVRATRSRASSPSSPAATRRQALTGWWAQQFGTPNFAAHGGFCSVNMAAAGLYTFGGSFWEFGEPDWEHTRYFMLFGVAEDHASNPIKIGLGKLKARGAKIVAVNPVPHRLRRDRRRMDRHPARHRRAVRRRADPRTAARRARSISTIWCATPTRPGW